MDTVTDSLIRAAKRGDLVALQKAMQSDANLNSVDSQGWTPLFHAAHQGNIEALNLLIQAGADVNHGRERGFTALFSAVMSGHVDAVHACWMRAQKSFRCKGLNCVVIPFGKIQKSTKPFLVR